MKTNLFITSVGILCLLACTVRAQTPVTAGAPLVAPAVPDATTAPWSLGRCISYAQEHNIGVQQRTLNIEDRRVQLSTARMSRLPDLGASLGSNIYFGRGPSRDGTYKDNTQLSGSLGVSASMPLFQGLRINRQIEGAKLGLAAAVQDMERAKEDVAVNVMTLYLEVLFQKELAEVAEKQLALSTQQAQRSRELVETGRQPASALYESEALQANDQLNLTQARNSLQLALLDLSQALNRPSAAGFDIEIPRLDSLTLESMRQLGDPNRVYDYAETHRPHIEAERLRVAGSENAVRIARSALYPTLSLSGGYGTNVYRSYASGAVNPNFWDQIRNNGNEYAGLSINIPIFNRRATRNNIRSATIALRSQQLALTEAQQNLRKEIEQAYYNADAAYMKYRSAEKALASARVAFAFEQQKADAGRSTVFDFNDARTRMEKAESELIRSKYEFIFRSKILDFYRDEPLEF